MNTKKTNWIWISLVLTLILFACQKESIQEGSYTGHFRGKSTTPSDTMAYNELNVPIQLTNLTESGLTMNDSFPFELRHDSLFGFFHFPDKDYLIDPYLVGVSWYDKENCFFTGQYAAVFDTTTAVKGVFSIQSND